MVTKSLKPILQINLLKLVDDTLYFNPDFSHESRKIRLCPVPFANFGEGSSEMIDDSAESPSSNEDQKIVLQALITRIMKQHRELSPSRLVQLVAESSSFGPDVTNSLLQSCLDQLVEKQYIELDNKRDLYIYLA